MSSCLQQYVKLPLYTAFNNTAYNREINVAKYLTSAHKQMSFIIFLSINKDGNIFKLLRN
jgi:hypothetical protein